MPNPITVEKHFQNVLATLAHSSSGRKRLLELGRFLDSLEDDFVAYEPYLLELMQRLPDMMRALEVTGCAPEPLHDLVKKLRALQMQLAALAAIEGLSTALDQLQQNVARLYAYAGDWQKSLALLDEGNTASWQTWLTAISNGCHQSPQVLLRELREYAQRDHSEIGSALDEMAECWTPMNRAKENSVLAPVIERSLFQSNSATEEGGLRCLTIQILGAAPGEQDEIDADVHVLNAPTTSNILQTPVTASRRLLAETHPQLTGKYFAGRVKFESAPAMHEGGSANLAIAALFYCAATRYAEQRLQYRLAANVAITGEVKETGEVLPVDHEALGAKIKAVFFSWVEYFVVPKAQLGAVEILANELAQRYPNRQLTIIGVKHLGEIFYDRRLAVRECAGIAKHIARKAWRKKFTVGGLATTGLLVLIIGKLLYGPLDKNPVSGEFVEESFLIKNKYGEQLDRIWVGAPTVSRANENLVTRRLFADFYDADKDGTNEVISLQEATRETDNINLIYCKSIVKDSVLWSAPLRRMLHFPNNSGTESDHFRPQSILAGDFDGDGAGEIFVIARHDLFPSLVLKLDAKTGRELGDYIHAGHLEAMQAVDLDDDGITEILLCGINNAFRAACLVVLDPRFVAGQSPSTGAYVVEGYPPGLERGYMLIPKTIVGEALRYKSKYNRVDGLEVQKSSKRLVVLLNDIFPADQMYLAVNSAKLLGFFKFDLQPESFGTADDYDLMAEKLFDDNQISRNPDKAYFEEYKKTLRYWDGDGWQNQPVRNKRYLEAGKVK